MEKNQKFDERSECSYDERKKEFTIKKIYERKGLVSTIMNVYTGEKEIKDFMRAQLDAKKKAKKTIQDMEDAIIEVETKQANMVELVDLTPEQKDLIENLRIVGTYQEYDKLEQQKTQQIEALKNMKERMKLENAALEKQKNTCKVKF